MPEALRPAFRANSDLFIASEEVLAEFRDIVPLHRPHGHAHITEFTHALLGVAVARAILCGEHPIDWPTGAARTTSIRRHSQVNAGSSPGRRREGRATAGAQSAGPQGTGPPLCLKGIAPAVMAQQGPVTHRGGVPHRLLRVSKAAIWRLGDDACRLPCDLPEGINCFAVPRYQRAVLSVDAWWIAANDAPVE